MVQNEKPGKPQAGCEDGEDDMSGADFQEIDSKRGFQTNEEHSTRLLEFLNDQSE